MLTRSFATCILLLALAAGAFAEHYTFKVLDPQVPGFNLYGPMAIDNRGDVAFDSDSESLYLLDTRGNLKQVLVPNCLFADGEALLSDGTIGGTSSFLSGQATFFSLSKKGLLTALPSPPRHTATLSGMNEHGDFTLGVKGVGSELYAYYFEHKQFHLVQYPGVTYINLSGISNNGTVVGTLFDTKQGFLLHNGHFKLFEIPNTFGNFPAAISPNGHFIVGVALTDTTLTNWEGYVLEKKHRYTPLNYSFPKHRVSNGQTETLSQVQIFPKGVNDHGVVCGYAQATYTGPNGDDLVSVSFIAEPEHRP